MKIIIGAVISRHPFVAGSVWNRLHTTLGLLRLGHDVYYIEELAPKACVDEQGRRCDYSRSINRRLFARTMRQFELMERACQIYDGGAATSGMSRDAVTRVAKDADLILNFSGHVTSDFVLGNVRRRVYLDQDPVYTQLWHAAYGCDLNFAMHDVFLSVGLNIGTPHSHMPDGGVKWRHTLPPVVLDFWPFHFDPACRCFTTVASWGGTGDLCYKDEWYKSKYEEFVRFAALPRHVTQAMEAVLTTFREDDPIIQLLRDGGWRLAAGEHLRTLADYQDYITRSRAEIGIAKNAYVKANSGWFSDRSVHYLASGKPVLAQATGFERYLPTDQGLLTFRDMEEAIAGVDQINRDYEANCHAARAIAEENLDYRKVLPGMLDACMAD